MDGDVVAGRADGPVSTADEPDLAAAGTDAAADTHADAVTCYAAEVRAEFADLSAEEVADLLEDLEEHLREVAAEVGVATADDSSLISSGVAASVDSATLRDRLGSPQDYARELRASAGLPPRDATNPPRSRPRPSLADQVRARVVRVRDSVTATAPGRAVAEYLPSLRSAWWIVRAWILVAFLQAWTWRAVPIRVIPTPADSTLFGALLLAAAIPASVWVGRRPPFVGRRATLFRLAQTALAVFALGVVASAQTRGDDGDFAASASFDMPAVRGGLSEGGRPVTNLFVYDKSGHLLQGVFVYDQNGDPVSTGPGGFVTAQMLQDDQGFPVLNQYPEVQARTVEYLPDGSARALVSPWIQVRVPQGVHPAPDQPEFDFGGLPDGMTPTPTVSGPTASGSAGSASPTSPVSGPTVSPTPIPTSSGSATPSQTAATAQPGAGSAPVPSATSAPVSPSPGAATTR